MNSLHRVLKFIISSKLIPDVKFELALVMIFKERFYRWPWKPTVIKRFSRFPYFDNQVKVTVRDLVIISARDHGWLSLLGVCRLMTSSETHYSDRPLIFISRENGFCNIVTGKIQKFILLCEYFRDFDLSAGNVRTVTRISGWRYCDLDSDVKMNDVDDKMVKFLNIFCVTNRHLNRFNHTETVGFYFKGFPCD